MDLPSVSNSVYSIAKMLYSSSLPAIPHSKPGQEITFSEKTPMPTSLADGSHPYGGSGGSQAELRGFEALVEAACRINADKPFKTRFCSSKIACNSSLLSSQPSAGGTVGTSPSLAWVPQVSPENYRSTTNQMDMASTCRDQAIQSPSRDTAVGVSFFYFPHNGTTHHKIAVPVETQHLFSGHTKRFRQTNSMGMHGGEDVSSPSLPSSPLSVVTAAFHANACGSMPRAICSNAYGPCYESVSCRDVGPLNGRLPSHMKEYHSTMIMPSKLDLPHTTQCSVVPRGATSLSMALTGDLPVGNQVARQGDAMTDRNKKGKKKKKLTNKDDDGSGHTDTSRKRNRTPNVNYSEMSPAEQLAFQRSRARRYGALARERQYAKEQKKQEELDRLKGLEILVEAAPNAMLLLSDDARGCILFANRQCKAMLQFITTAAVPKPLTGRCLWEWLDVPDRSLFHAAIVKCVVSREVIHTVRCTLRRPSALIDIPVSGPSQQQQEEEGKKSLKVEVRMRACADGIVTLLWPQNDEK